MLNNAASPVRRMALWAASSALAGCLSVREETRQGEQNACTSCHGVADPARDPLLQSAPPRDLLGNSSPDYPGVGAHSAHLLPGTAHAAIACSECHEVPSAVAAPGHADSALPAELQFGALARNGGAEPRYDALARRCADTYCHGTESPAWTQSAELEPCGGCHGLPPPAPHPQSAACAVCHAQVIDSERVFIDAARHVDGQVDFLEPGCSGCHGDDVSAAPPPSLDGGLLPQQRGVGAHRAHLAGGDHSRPLACSECHALPDPALPSTHPDGAGVVVAFSGTARAGPSSPAWDSEQATCSGSWCHNPSHGIESTGVSWALGSALACTSCHGMPPAAPHPQVQDCGLCHADVFSRESGAIAERSRHVDGVVDVQVPSDCTSCHSGAAAASAGTGPSAAPDSGAHSAHTLPAGAARAVECEECHVVPGSVFSPGHLDSLPPAELRFSGVATAFEARPSFNAGSCTETYCHGDSFIGGRPSGGVQTQPVWAAPAAGTALTCQSCHGMPPPAPHPEAAADCSSCHRNIDAAQVFSAPATHIDGVVTFFLP